MELQPKYRHEIKLDGLPRIESNGSKKHYYVTNRERQTWKARVVTFCRINKIIPLTPLTKVKIICTRYSHGKGSDYVNRAGSFKPILDGLTEAGIIVDDNDDVIVEQHYPQGKAKPKCGYITVLIEEV